ENSAYVAGVNRIGKDGANVNYNGGSVVVNAKGEELAHLGSESSIKTVRLDREKLDSYREKFPVHQDADRFTIK
ncbi:MAG: nitrilase family protein, partial [Cyclobacteriaceae bacterium]